MKISKLFHWLYAFLMMLPVFALLSAVLINTFNMSTKEQTIVNYRYETNDVVTSSNIIQGNAYHFKIEEDDIYSFIEWTLTPNPPYLHNGIISFRFFNIDNYNFDNYDLDFADLLTSCITPGGFESVVFDCGYSRTDIYSYWTDNEDNDYFTAFMTSQLSYDTFSLEGDCLITWFGGIEFIDLSFLSRCENIPIDSVESSSLEARDVFYQAIDDVQSKPIFSWAYNSFLVAPFSYIVALFGIPTNHVIVELLSYWLAISIIWLVFDLIMYIPLLVHRWLDKGVLE